VVTVSARLSTPRTGSVGDFDDHRGLGTVIGDDGRRYPFHCTAVSDGSRHIDVGTRISFVLAAAHLGRLEARSLVPVGPVVQEVGD
jgi:cold shock CspA family protein